MLNNIDDLSGSSSNASDDEDVNQIYYNEEIDPVDAGSGGSSKDYKIDEEEEESKLAGASNEDFNCSSNSVQSSSTGMGEQVMVSISIMLSVIVVEFGECIVH